MNSFQLMSRRQLRARAVENGIGKVIEFQGPTFFDSGGFLFQSDGKTRCSPEDLVDLYEQLSPTFGAVLDVPLSSKASSQNNIWRWNETLTNTRLMLARKRAFELVPVFHADDLSAVTSRVAQLQELIPNPQIVAIGSLVPLLKASHIGNRFSKSISRELPSYKRWRFIAKLCLSLRRLYPRSVLHAFGVGSLSTMYLLFLLGIDSVDSVSWRLKAGYGAIQLPGISDRFFTASSTSQRNRRLLNKTELEILASCCCPACGDLSYVKRISRLMTSFYARATHNAWLFLSEVDAMRRAKNNGQLQGFVHGRLGSNKTYSEILNHVVQPEIEIDENASD